MNIADKKAIRSKLEIENLSDELFDQIFLTSDKDESLPQVDVIHFNSVLDYQLYQLQLDPDVDGFVYEGSESSLERFRFIIENAFRDKFGYPDKFDVYFYDSSNDYIAIEGVTGKVYLILDNLSSDIQKTLEDIREIAKDKINLVSYSQEKQLKELPEFEEDFSKVIKEYINAKKIKLTNVQLKKLIQETKEEYISTKEYVLSNHLSDSISKVLLSK